MNTVTRTQIVDNLHTLGINPGDSVMLHSSLYSLGWVDGGADAVVQAFLELLGPEGALLTPAFTLGAWTDRLSMEDCDCDCPQEFCPSVSPSHEGAIPNAALRLPDRLRSCHPTHSWIANGGMAAQFVSDHRDSQTICGSGNPFEKLVEQDGCIVTLGVGVRSITLWHYYEDILNAPYRGYFHPKERHLSYCTAGLRIQYQFPGVMQDVVLSSGIMETGNVGKSVSGLIRARTFRSFMATILTDNPYCFVMRPSSRKSGNLGLDAMLKGAAMVKAWTANPVDSPQNIIWFNGRDDDIVRKDCPAFFGYHPAKGSKQAICTANGRHPDFFREGGVFGDYGITTCGRCSWHHQFPQ